MAFMCVICGQPFMNGEKGKPVEGGLAHIKCAKQTTISGWMPLELLNGWQEWRGND